MMLIDQAPWILYPSLIFGCLFALLLPRMAPSSSDSDTSPGSGRHTEVWWILGITLIAFLLRVDGLTFGLPNNFHPDEIPKLNAIERMRAAGDLNPRYFLHPSLLLYATHFTQRVGEWLGLLDGSREALNLSGRIVSLVAGTLTIPVLWILGRAATGSSAVGVLSAALLAVFPLHITCSRYLKEDALVTFWMVVAAAIVMTTVANPRARWRLVWAGFFAGVAASSKYTGIIFFLFVVIAPWLRSRTFKPDTTLLAPVAAALLMTVVGFLACSPYALLDWGTFLDDFGYERRHMSKGHMVVISPWTHYWSYQIGRSLIPGIGLINTVLALIAAGCAVVWFVKERSRMALLSLLAVGMTYLPAEMVNAKPEPQPDRYLMVCLPWCALLIATLVIRLSGARRRLLGVVLVVVVIAFPLVRSLQLARDLKNDTRLQLASWINSNLPAGSKIAVDYLWYGPPLDPSRYSVTSLHGSEILESIRVGELRRTGYDYVIISSFFKDRFFRQQDNLGAFRELFRRIERELPTVKQIQAPSGPYGFHNPTLTLYRLK